MTDLARRRAALNLLGQIPADPKDRRAIIGYMLALLPFLDGENDNVIELPNARPLHTA